jgi:hypothetical protein
MDEEMDWQEEEEGCITCDTEQMRYSSWRPVGW